MKELEKIIISAQAGDKNSLQYLITKFTPIIMKYVKKMNYDEDFKSDLITFFIETIYNIDSI